MPTPCAPGLIRKETKERRGKGQKEWPENASERQLSFHGRRKQRVDKTARGESRWRQRREAALRGITSSTGRRRGCFCLGYGVRLCFTSKSEDLSFEALCAIDAQIMTPIIKQCKGQYVSRTSGSEYVGTFRAMCPEFWMN